VVVVGVLPISPETVAAERAGVMRSEAMRVSERSFIVEEVRIIWDGLWAENK
jgi:hypothetical protein